MKELLDFYQRLSHNNNKPWFDEHRKEYEELKGELSDFTKRFIKGIEEFDPRCQGLQVKDCTYRINRDIRFTQDKRPYKDWHGVYVCPQGKKSGMAGYYIHFEPVNNLYFICAGLYNPTREVLQSIREQISLEPESFHQAVLACGKEFQLNWDNALKRMPRGYNELDAHSEYYRLKGYEISKMVTEEEVLSDDFLKDALADFRNCYELNELLNTCYDYAYDSNK